MTRRGRPKVQDILTPREWEVLDLIREGLSNQQIADGLGITLAGAKFHVSEIISKLGVTSREEAARWAEGPPARPLPALFGWLFAKKALLWRASLGSAGAAALGGLVLLFVLALDNKTEYATAGLGKVAFIRQGDLWVKSLPAGPERQLTKGGSASSPRWSASGEWILYWKGPPADPGDIGVRVIRADGSGNRWVGINVGAAWSPVTDLLALTLEDSTLVVEDADGSGRRELLPTVPDRAFNPLDRRLWPAWSSDGRWIVFEEHRADHIRAAAYAYIGIRAIRVDGSDERELFAAQVSPGGERAEGAMPGLWAAAGGGAPFYLSLGPAGPDPADAGGLPTNLMGLFTKSHEATGVHMLTYRDFMAASPDGRSLALVAGVALVELPLAAGATAEGVRSTPRSVDAQTNKTIVIMDLQTGRSRALTDGELVAVSPAWSADGHSIAFVARPDTGPVDITALSSAAEQSRRIWIVDDQGSAASPLPIEGAGCRQERPLWSADGTHLVFACLAGEPAASLWLVPASGGKATQIIDAISPSTLEGRSFFAGYQGHIDWDRLYDWWRPN